MTPISQPPPLRIDDLLGNRIILEAGQEAIVGRAGTFPVGTDDAFCTEACSRFGLAVWDG